MSFDELHQNAQNSTPADITVPQTWGGLIIWAIGKWGVGVVFLALLVPVYQDLKASNNQLVAITHANVSALTALAKEMATTGEAVRRLEESHRFKTIGE